METETGLCWNGISGVTLLVRMKSNADLSEIAQSISRKSKCGYRRDY
jgi:hypothetical protein